MKKYILTLNPDDFVYARALNEFFQKHSGRIDSVCVFPSRAPLLYQLSYYSAIIRIIGVWDFIPSFIRWNFRALFSHMLADREEYSIVAAAERAEIPVRKFSDVNGEDFIRFVESRKPNGILNICSQIYKKASITRLPPIYNFHGGYLPGNRGRFPQFWAYMKNEPQVLTCHQIDETIDGGHPIYHYRLPLDRSHGVKEMMEHLMEKFPSILPHVIELINDGQTETFAIECANVYGPQPTSAEIRQYRTAVARAKAELKRD